MPEQPRTKFYDDPTNAIRAGIVTDPERQPVPDPPYPAGRVCDVPGCGVAVSRYNPKGRCYEHRLRLGEKLVEP